KNLLRSKMANKILLALSFSVAISFACPVRLLADKTDERCRHASALLMQGDLQGAQTELESILRKKPNYENAKVLLGVVHTRLGRQAERRGDRTTAVAEFREAIRLDPDEAYWHSSLARLVKAQGDVDEARKEWAIAAQLSPDDWSLAKLAGSGARPETGKDGSTDPEVAAPARTQPYSVGGGVTAPIALVRSEPEYTEKARKAH